MKNKEIKKLTKSELNKNLTKLKKDIFNLRFQKINGQLTNTSQMNIIRKQIARIKTQLNK